MDGPTNLIQWNRFYVSRDYQKPIQPSPDQAPVIRDPAMPMINLSASLLSWSPFRKELDRWSTKLDLFSETSSTKNMSEYSKLLKLQKTQDSNMSKVSNDNSMMTSGRHTSVISRDGTAKNTTSAVLLIPKVGCVFPMVIRPNSAWVDIDRTTIGMTHPSLGINSTAEVVFLAVPSLNISETQYKVGAIYVNIVW